MATVASRITIVTRLRLMAAAVTIVMLALSAFCGLSYYNGSLDQRLSTTRNYVNAAVAVAARYEEQARSGVLSQADARAKALDEIGAIRYGDQDYVWVNDMTPRMVMHPMKPQMNGQDLGSYKDPNGKALFLEMVDTVQKSGRGYVDYVWSSPVTSQLEPKRSYVVAFAPWGWVLGSGVYVTEVRASATRFAAAIAAAGILTGAIVLAYVQRIAGSIRRRLEAIAQHLDAIAHGDLTGEISPGREDEIGRLALSTNSMRMELRKLVASVRSGVTSVEEASAAIASASQDLSQRTESSASSLQQTAASMEELAGAVKISAESARQANQLVLSARDAAAGGGEVMARVVAAMREISALSEKITDIVGVIDGIAFQTNILALNASVEAARAGDQGRGFSVVASEVRSLAQRAAQSAHEIKDVITRSRNQVRDGATLVADAGAAMSSIVAEVKLIANLIGEISTAAAEQSGGIGQITDAVAHMDAMTQQNAAAAEESAAAAMSLREDAAHLHDAAAAFRVA